MRDILPIPAEVELFGVYLPPLLIAFTFGAIGMGITLYFLNRYRLSRYFYLPEYVLLAITTIYTILIGTFVIPI